MNICIWYNFHHLIHTEIIECDTQHTSIFTRKSKGNKEDTKNKI